MTEPDFKELAEDIRENGLRNPILMYEGKILDGRNRYRACLLVKVAPEFIEFTGDSPIRTVLSLNLHRRHLTPGQKAMVAARVSAMKLGDNQHTKKEGAVIKAPSVSQEKAAKALGISKDSITRAKKIAEVAPEKAAEVSAGTKTLNAAAREIKEEAQTKRQAKADLPVDGRGVRVPPGLVALWARREELTAFAHAISGVRVAVKRGFESHDPLYAHIGQSLHADLDRVYHAIASSKPYCVCPMCQGAGCQACKESGFMGKFQFKTFVPAEFKKASER
jgi:hypothetical protein